MTEVEIVDPRSDAEPDGWSEFQRRQRLHPVWAFDLMGADRANVHAGHRYPPLLP